MLFRVDKNKDKYKTCQKRSKVVAYMRTEKRGGILENNGFIRICGRTNVLCVILTHPLEIYCFLIYNGYIKEKAGGVS